jgi:hypothetical protein
MDSKDRYRELADLPLEGGYPTAESGPALADELFFQRATQGYLWALPAMNMFAMKEGLGALSGTGYNVLSVFEKRLRPNTLITTPNSDVIYGLGFADLAESGPLVLEAPAMLQAILDDFWHRPLVGPAHDGEHYLGDVGIPGPDQGQGGRYLIAPEGWDGEVPDDHFLYTSPTNGVFIFLRGFFKSTADLSPGLAAIEGLIVRPLEGEAKPMEFKHVSDADSDALFARDLGYFEALARFTEGERIDAVDPYMHGVLASLGIAKGRPFSPDERERELLDLGAKTGWRMAKQVAADFDQGEKALWWEDRHWIAHVRTNLDDFTHTLLDEEWRDRRTGHTDPDAKAHMFVNHYSISTAMISHEAGKGAKYANAYKDSDGDYLMGENTYRIELPADPPANILWSMTIYDAESASGVDAEGQEYPSLNSLGDLLPEADGSTTIFVAPERPDEATNWLKSVPGRGWFGLVRWYGPRQEFFDREYKPGDFVRID